MPLRLSFTLYSLMISIMLSSSMYLSYFFFIISTSNANCRQQYSPTAIMWNQSLNSRLWVSSMQSDDWQSVRSPSRVRSISFTLSFMGGQINQVYLLGTVVQKMGIIESCCSSTLGRIQTFFSTSPSFTTRLIALHAFSFKVPCEIKQWWRFLSSANRHSRSLIQPT